MSKSPGTKEQYDCTVLKMVRNGKLAVDIEKGVVYGAERGINGRTRIGTLVGRQLRLSLKCGSTAFTYPSARLIYLVANGKIPSGFQITLKDMDSLNVGVNNLKLQKGQKPRRHASAWSEEEDSFLKENYKDLSYDKLSENLGRSVHAVRNRMILLGLKKCKAHRRWTPADDEKLQTLIGKGKHYSIAEIARKMGVNKSSVRHRVRKGVYRGDVRIKDLNKNNFYLSFKSAMTRGSLWSKCCLCGYEKHVHLHHLDGNRSNSHVSNMAVLCPNHHAEVEHGEHRDKDLYAIWARRYSDGSLGEVKDNRHLVRSSQCEGSTT